MNDQQQTLVTTIKIDIDTWRRLQALKLHPGDAHNDVVRRLLDGDAERREEPKNGQS